MGCVYLQPQEGNGGISLSKYFPVPPASDSIESHAIQHLHSWGKLGLSFLPSRRHCWHRVLCAHCSGVPFPIHPGFILSAGCTDHVFTPSVAVGCQCCRHLADQRQGPAAPTVIWILLLPSVLDVPAVACCALCGSCEARGGFARRRTQACDGLLLHNTRINMRPCSRKYLAIMDATCASYQVSCCDFNE